MGGDVSETEYALKWPSLGCRLVPVERSEGEVDHGGEERGEGERYGKGGEKVGGEREVLKVSMKDAGWAKWAVRVQGVRGLSQGF